MKILSVKDWYYDQLRKHTGKTMSHFELAENYSKYLLEQQERSYSDEEVIKLLHKRDEHMNTYDKLHGGFQTPKEWFEQFKKK